MKVEVQLVKEVVIRLTVWEANQLRIVLGGINTNFLDKVGLHAPTAQDDIKSIYDALLNVDTK